MSTVAPHPSWVLPLLTKRDSIFQWAISFILLMPLIYLQPSPNLVYTKPGPKWSHLPKWSQNLFYHKLTLHVHDLQNV